MPVGICDTAPSCTANVVVAEDAFSGASFGFAGFVVAPLVGTAALSLSSSQADFRAIRHGLRKDSLIHSQLGP